MRVIKEYELKGEQVRVKLPESSEILCAADVGEKIALLVEIDTDFSEATERAFLVVKVGEEIKKGMFLVFLGNVRLSTGETTLVFEIL
jgi:hypothetical protein